jgi:hypothetical protein
MKLAHLLVFLSPFVLVCCSAPAQNVRLAGDATDVSGFKDQRDLIKDQIDGRQLAALAGSQLAGLKNLVCNKTVTRSWLDQSSGAIHRIDVIGAVGGYIDFRDEERPVMRNGRQLSRTMRELKGSWSTGEFGALLAEEMAVIASKRTELAATETEDSWVIRYRVPASLSAWDLLINGRHWWPGYDGSIAIGKASNRITRVTRTVDDVAPECTLWRFAWQVEYAERAINNHRVAVPVRARYENCRKGSSRCDVNEIAFRDYREFQSFATIIYTEPEIPEAPPAPAVEPSGSGASE